MKDFACDDPLMLVRPHQHLCRPLLNDSYTRSRIFTHQQVTAFVFAASLWTGYAYGRLRHDEVLRRRMYAKYTNGMIGFDFCADRFERLWSSYKERVLSFDSAHAWWALRKSAIAEFRARRKLDKEISLKVAQEDEISRMLLALDKVEETKET